MSVLLTFALAPVVRWRRFWFRSTHPNCPICGDKLKSQIGDLLAQGFYQSAVTSARLRLELMAAAYYRKVLDQQGLSISKKHRGVPFYYVISHLMALGEINVAQRNELTALYKKTSTIVHGDYCSRAAARLLVRKVDDSIKAIAKGGAA